MAEEVRADLLIGRDSLTPGLLKAAHAADDASSNIKDLTRQLLELNRQRATPVIELKDATATAKLEEITGKLRRFGEATAAAKLTVTDKEGQAKLAAWQLKLDRLGQKVINPKVTVEGLAKADAELLAFEAELDRLGRKRETVSITERISKSDFLKPSLAGAGVALSPALIPLAAGVGTALAGVTASFGAATLGAAAFGLMAKSVLTAAGTDAGKLATLQAKLATDTTAAQRKSTQQQITALEHGWSGAFKSLVTSITSIQKQWKSLSQSIAIPALVPWLHAVRDGLHFIKPFLDPVAAVFRSWGQDIDRYFASHAGSTEITRIARSLGQLSASQLGDIGRAIVSIVKGVVALGKDAGISGGAIANIGGNLAIWADAFNNWAHSAKARADVQAFLRYLHQNGPFVAGLLRNLALAVGSFVHGAAGLGSLELRALDDFLSLLNKLPQSVAKPLIEAAGAFALLAKTGVLKVGITLVGAASRLLTGGTVALGGGAAAAEIRGAMVSGGAAAAAEIRAAMAGGGAVAGGEEAAGAAAGSRWSGGFRGAIKRILGGGGIIEALGLTSGAEAGGIAAGALAIAGGLALRIRQDLKRGFQGFSRDIPTWLGSGTLGPLGVSAQGWADTILNHFRHGILSGEDNVRHALAVGLSAPFRWAINNITGITNKGIGTMRGILRPNIFDPFTAASRRAANAIRGDFNRQQDAAHSARRALTEYSTAIKQNGVNSSEARSARTSLIRDLVNAGVKAGTARADVSRYTNAVKDNGLNSDQARAARRRLITDIVNTSSNSRQGRRDLAGLTTAIQQHGLKSDAARAARQRLIKDLENAGLSAKTARRLVDEFSAAVVKIPKGQTVHIVGRGAGKVSFKVGTTGQIGQAEGGLVPASGGRPPAPSDTVAAMLTPGEAVIPKRMVPAFAPMLKAAGLPGFASGGVVSRSGEVAGTQAGTPPATGRWMAQQKARVQDMGATQLGEVATALINMLKAQAAAASGALGGDAGANMALARKLMPAWASGGQWAAWRALWTGESGWSRFAENKSSGAYGIPQALPASKMPFAAQKAGGSHAGPQIDWGASYIKSRYGSPSGAYSAWLSRSPHWYDKGGLLPPGVSMAVNNTGRAERVIPATDDSSEEMVALLRRTVALLEAAPGRHGEATARVLNGVARRAGASGTHAVRR